MNPSAPLPDVLLERYLLGELPPDRREAVRLQLEEDAVLRRRLEALRLSDQSILAAHPSLPRSAAPAPRPAFAGRLEGAFRRLREAVSLPGLSGLPGLRVAAPAFAALVLLVVLLAPGRRAPEADAPMADAGIRLKGSEAGLVVYRKTRAGAELLPPRSAARPGDTLQLFYQSRKTVHGLIFSVDGNGAITLHLPEAEGAAAELRAGGLQSLPHAYLLDKAPRLERFYLVTSAEPFSVPPILAAVRRRLAGGGGAPDSLEGLPAGFRQYTYTLRKDEGAGSGRADRRREGGR